MKRKYLEYTDDEIISNAKKVTSMSKLLDSLNLKTAGGNFANMKRKLQLLNVDTSHWLGQGWSKDQQKKDWSEYTKSGSIKHHLIKKLGHVCDNCKMTEWENTTIPLELHHIDGDRTNNKIDNLQLLCCNCHAMTKNWRNRKR